MKVLGIDVNKYDSCQNYQISCVDKLVASDWILDTKIQSKTGQFWFKFDDKSKRTVPRVKIAYMHDLCQDCNDAPCVKACKQKAIYKGKDGRIIIDPVKCAEQKDCIPSCPYGVIYITDDSNLAQKHKWCAQVLDKGWKEPSCIDSCPTVAFILGEREDMTDLIAKSERLHFEAKSVTFHLGNLKSKRSINERFCQ